ncbi:hypothetical protein, conserved [Eimeria brunetti]|uniref:Uncharacterized protein n=1 Tax=Eimeria brunetti TaxID=51314 RepID=U6LH06_9EIME|nr:hypothetical protein, conserved [Eimeria brunetti]
MLEERGKGPGGPPKNLKEDSMECKGELVSRTPLPRPPLRPYEVYVTRRVPLVVYFRRCLKLLRGPHARAVIRGTGGCIETAICVAQDVVAAFGGQVVYGACKTEAEAPAAPAAAAAGAAAGRVAAAAATGKGACKGEQEQGVGTATDAAGETAEARFAAAASKLAAFSSKSSAAAALLSLSAETSSTQAFDEVIHLRDTEGEEGEALAMAGIRQELSSFVRQRNVSAIKIELHRLYTAPC